MWMWDVVQAYISLLIKLHDLWKKVLFLIYLDNELENDLYKHTIPNHQQKLIYLQGVPKAREKYRHISPNIWRFIKIHLQ